MYKLLSDDRRYRWQALCSVEDPDRWRERAKKKLPTIPCSLCTCVLYGREHGYTDIF